jgi:hypothetical protein
VPKETNQQLKVVDNKKEKKPKIYANS